MKPEILAAIVIALIVFALISSAGAGWFFSGLLAVCASAVILTMLWRE